MKGIRLVILALLMIAFGVSGASADIVLFDWGLNLNGTVYTPGGSPLPGSVNAAGFDFATGLGTITFTTNASGKFTSFFDHELSETINTFFNEYGSTSGSPVAGQSWEIDEPGYTFGDIYNNFLAGTLDNSNGVPIAAPDDVAMALGWNINLAAGETALLRLTLATTAPAGGFYLQQTDPDSGEDVYFSGNVTIRGGGEPTIPEPATMLLLGSGLAGLVGFGRKKLFKK